LIWIGIDEFAVASRPDTIRSVLGSCVGISLFASGSDWFAFNHFLDVASGARVSEEMLAAIRGKGCRDFRAIIAGGARQAESNIDIGERNIVFAREFLQRNRIPLLREDVGGTTGRTVSVGMTNLGPELVTEYHGERTPPVEEGTRVRARDALKSSREAYEMLLAISQRSAARKR
jgi:chemotaxis protein CheD